MDEVVSYRKRRGVEAFMLIFAVALGSGGYLITHLNRDAALPQQWPWAVGILAGIALVLHLVVRWRLPYADPLILPAVMLLNGLGLAMIHRLDLASTPAMHSAELQLMWLLIAVAGAIAVIFLLPDYRVLQRYTYTLFLAGMALLMLPLLPGLGLEKNGARIWIHFGNYSFQPAELAKLVLVIAFASYLVDKSEVLALAGGRVLGIELPRPRDLGPILVMWLASLAVLVFQKDLGTSLLFFGLFVMMLYVATQKASWAVLGTILFSGGAYAAYLLFDHVQVRVSGWLDPFSNYDRNYQVIQAQFGIAWGGLFGTGWGLGRPTLTPLAKTDFISAAIGEELGITGLMAVMVIYAVIVSRGLRAALVAKDSFGKLLSAGLAFVFAIQVFAILGGVTRLLPLTGLTTPFMSQGGSSLVANWLMVAFLLVLTHQVRSPAVGPSLSPVADLASENTQLIQVGSAPAAVDVAESPATTTGRLPRIDPDAPLPSAAGLLPAAPSLSADEPTQVVAQPGTAAQEETTQEQVAQEETVQVSSEWTNPDDATVVGLPAQPAGTEATVPSAAEATVRSAAETTLPSRPSPRVDDEPTQVVAPPEEQP